MAQVLDIPIRFRFLKIPHAWEIRTVKADAHHKQQEYAFPTYLPDETVSELNGWTCRDEFLAIADGDEKALLKFLDKVGVFHVMEGELVGHWSNEVFQHYRAEHTVPLSVAGIWKFRDSLRRALLNKKEFKAAYAPPLSQPEESGLEFPLSFELTNVASGVVTVTDAYRMLLATVFVDITRGLKFKVCARKDCQGGQRQIFPVESGHGQKYCSQYCGHLESVRRNRRNAKRKRG